MYCKTREIQCSNFLAQHGNQLAITHIIQLQIITSLEKKETKQKQCKCNGFTKSAYEWLVKINFIFIQSFARGTLSHWSLIFDLSKVCIMSLFVSCRRSRIPGSRRLAVLNKIVKFDQIICEV